jgi:hypothetical protein
MTVARSDRHMPSDGGEIFRNLRNLQMTAADFRRIALSLEGVEAYSHAGCRLFVSEAENLLRWPHKEVTEI